MRSPEIPVLEQEETDDGFSEKKMARAREGRKADNSQVKKYKPFSTLKQKIFKRLARRGKQETLPKDPQDLVK